MEAFVLAGWVVTGQSTSEPTSSAQPGAGRQAARTAKLARLLSSLREAQVAHTLRSESDGPPDAAAEQPASTLADRTFEAVLQLRSQEDAGRGRQTLRGDEPTLSELDLEAVDALMLEEFSIKRVPSALRERAMKAHALMALAASEPNSVSTTLNRNSTLSLATAANAKQLVDATMHRVLAVRASAPIVMPEPARRGRVPLREIASVAAVLFIGGITLWPMAAAAGSARSRSLCESNMASLASAFTRYGADFRGLLPLANDARSRATADRGPLNEDIWWNVGDPRTSNSANLFTIHTANYAPIQATCCPGNEAGCKTMVPNRQDWNDLNQVSYSYFVMRGSDKPTWDGRGSSTTVILADRSPVIRRAFAGQTVSVGENSDNHAGNGQRVLRVDGSSDWLASPYDAGPGRNTDQSSGQRINQRLGTADNIWLPVSLEETLLQIRTQQEQGASQGMVVVPSADQAAKMRQIRLFGTETPGNATDAFLGP
jgi:hypothetical protein